MDGNKKPFDLTDFAAKFANGTPTLQRGTSVPSCSTSSSFTPLAETSPRSARSYTFLARYGRRSGSSGSGIRNAPLRNSSARDGQESNGTTDSPTHQPTTSTSTSISIPTDQSRDKTWLHLYQSTKVQSWSFLLGMLMSMLVFVVALIWSTFPAIDSDCLFPKFDSLHVQSPADFLNGFPLPHRINTTVHEAVLNEVRDSETLSNLILTRSEVCSSLNVTSRELIGRFACATKMYSYSDSKHAELTFLDEITVAHKQLSYTVSNVSYLSNLYHSIGPAYYTLVSAAVEALEAVQLSDFKQFAISAQPFSFKMAGLDATNLYWDPWIEKAKKLKEARLGIVVLEREMQRLEQIAQMVQEVDRNFERLPAAVVQGDKKWLEQKRDQLFAVVEWVAHVGQNWRKGIKLARGGESRQKWLKEWFRQHLAQHIVQDGEAVTDKKLDSWWANLDCGCRA